MADNLLFGLHCPRKNWSASSFFHCSLDTRWWEGPLDEDLRNLLQRNLNRKRKNHMEDYLQPLDSSLLTIEKLFPPEEKTTRLDKVLSFFKAMASGTSWGVLGQAIETTGKVVNVISSGKQRVQTVKYVKDAYEAKLLAEEEMAKIQGRERTMTLYIEKSFQAEMDSLSKRLILESHRLDIEHEERMMSIKKRYELAVLEMNSFAKQELNQINKTYAEIIRRNEMYCFLYRQYLKYLSDSKTSPGDMITEVSKRYMDIIERAIMGPNTDLVAFSTGIDGVMRLLEFLGHPDTFFISFDKFISQKSKMEELRDD